MANKEDIGKVGQEGGVNQDDTNSIGRCGLEWQQAAINRSSAKGSYGNVYFLSLYKDGQSTFSNGNVAPLIISECCNLGHIELSCLPQGF